MKICPNRACPFLEEYGEVAEYRDEIERCVDCGTLLVDSTADLRASLEEEPDVDDFEVDDLVVIATFDHPAQAHIHRGHLEAEGIPAFLFDEHMITNNWLATSALGGVRLAVPESTAAAALAILGKTPETEDDLSADTDVDEEMTEEMEEETTAEMDDIKCLRCQGEMQYLKEYKFESQDNNRGLFGTVFDMEERLTFDIYVCTNCRHTEFFFTGSAPQLDG